MMAWENGDGDKRDIFGLERPLTPTLSPEGRGGAGAEGFGQGLLAPAVSFPLKREPLLVGVQ